ncbi:hypothetical protein AG1IA_04465 [Rhizoctonia solani AG-1 IA]|uniref:Uncharacterized protein n=1 Tax=Thanatephorus cucumeris (strain AG1-IA) TaxID=983506 RepID=L8WYR1_THACA|nr:hypothetical protein AG1IA_04465 [Rhizoctonia solani AG-1 IA]
MYTVFPKVRIIRTLGSGFSSPRHVTCGPKYSQGADYPHLVGSRCVTWLQYYHIAIVQDSEIVTELGEIYDHQPRLTQLHT